MADRLTAEQVKEFKEAFDHFDEDKSGSIDAEELGKVMKELDEETEPDVLEEMIRSVDKDNSGKIEFDEFLTWMADNLAAQKAE
mmetsp:Transcript_14012/g.39833  ORF Transcript_14012/g.39833 Transcript_14012/m.39833 type:complete len:84 (+) Transcript_14012:66-317(+)|eukprot:CAMPEP_0119132488 /NCGR_PEP_ID=MMETSP1310-20130426/11866_1 /TAXON_ID=464262 /ORGANISM="Genus nov. species nov., Strain RCC2339" /LENGTH=83 /DNA_ID=CAMNT_0007123125 /DNA_START=63 /DNA_END=314 /DNA_ORIENTATION=+